ncbi:MAG: NUDIX hydrolase [Nanoarchaeota archaeon]|nr:NUDIX hydrolase [Nanoarchaeota archaeon]
MSEILQPGDRLIYKGHLTLVHREFRDKPFDVILSKDACCIMYIDPEDHVYFIRQYRVPMGKEILELPAETMDKPGLTSLEVIVEGLEEECGIKISPSQVHYFTTIGSSEGHDSEMVDLFYAYGPNKYVGQRLEDTEKINVVRIPFMDAYQMMLRGEIQGGKAVPLLQHEYIKRMEESYGPIHGGEP